MRVRAIVRCVHAARRLGVAWVCCGVEGVHTMWHTWNHSLKLRDVVFPGILEVLRIPLLVVHFEMFMYLGQQRPLTTHPFTKVCLT